VVVAFAAAAAAQVPNELISQTRSGVSGEGRSGGAAVSDDGRFVAFWSDAIDLVSGDRNERRDVFVRDRMTNTTQRVSIAFDGAEATGDSQPSSFPVAVSADGCAVVFSSIAPNLVADDGNGRTEDVFLYDRCTEGDDKIRLISRRPGGGATEAISTSADISADGERIVFQSADEQLVDGDDNGVADIFLFERSSGEIRRVSIATDGTQGNRFSITPSISGDGTVVAFASEATTLVPTGNNDARHIYVHDLKTGETTRVSVNSAGLSASNLSRSFLPDLNFDGTRVAFKSEANNLVEPPRSDTNGVPDVFLHDRNTGRTVRVSVDDFLNQAVGGLSAGPAVSADGNFVAFASFASNLVPNDDNLFSDVFVVDLGRREAEQTPNIERVDQGFGGLPPNAGVPDFPVAISANGRWIGFQSEASNLVEFGRDNNNLMDVFLACNSFDEADCAADTPTPTPSVTPTPECEENEDCPEGQVCVDNKCVTPTPTPTETPECEGNEDCPEGQVCVDNHCVTPTPTNTPIGFCTDNEDCPPGQVCVDNRCVTPTPTNTPIGFCTDNNDCPPGQVCVDNRCVTPTPTNTPIGFCTDNNDCPPGQVCVDNRCVTPTPTPTPEGFCTSNDDCPPDQVCVDNMCRDKTPTPSPTRKGGGGGGCSCEIDPSERAPRAGDAIAVLMPALLLLLRRRERLRQRR
jgi:Tol biopolymer transport system component